MRLSVLICLALFFTGCGGRIFVPSSYTPQQGKAVVAAIQSETLEIYAENIEQTGKHMIFDVEVINKTADPVMIDPHTIYYYGSDTPFKELLPGVNVQTSFGEAIPGARHVFALKEKEVNKDIRATVRSQQVVSTVLAIAAVALVVNDVVKDTEDFNQELWTASDARQANNRDLATFAGLITLDIISSGMQMQQFKQFEDLEYLPDEYLHQAMLLPGESVRGKVFLPRRDVDYVRLVVPVESRDYVFDFREASGKDMRSIRRSVNVTTPVNPQ